MNWFLDMCILIYFSNVKEEYSEKTIQFVKNKKNDRFFVCCYILEENLPKWIQRQIAIIEETKMKIKNPDYIIGTSYFGKFLFPKDKNKCEKLILVALKLNDKKKFIKEIEKAQLLIERRINYFLRNLTDKMVIPIKEIDFDLKSSLFSFLNNDSDSKTLASGIQQHNKEEITILTGDKKDWTKENIKWAFDSRPPLAKKYPKIPEIKYVQDV